MVARVDDGSGQVLIQQYQSRRVTKQRHVTDRTHATEGFQQKGFWPAQYIETMQEHTQTMEILRRATDNELCLASKLK